MLKKVVQQGRSGLSILSWGGWDDPNCARPTRAFLSRALREQGDRPSYPHFLFQHPLRSVACVDAHIVERQIGRPDVGFVAALS
jgi:hypothetical protein